MGKAAGIICRECRRPLYLKSKELRTAKNLRGSLRSPVDETLRWPVSDGFKRSLQAKAQFPGGEETLQRCIVDARKSYVDAKDTVEARLDYAMQRCERFPWTRLMGACSVKPC